MPEKTLLAFADHGSVGAMLPHQGRGGVRRVLGRAARLHRAQERAARKGRLMVLPLTARPAWNGDNANAFRGGFRMWATRRHPCKSA
jgi:hypothetical protein